MDAIQQFITLVRENLAQGAIDLELPGDDVSWNIIGTFKPETVAGSPDYDTASSSIPPQYEAKWKVKLQSGGRITGGDFKGNTLTGVGISDLLSVGQSANALYPDPTLVPLRAYATVKMILKRLRGILTVNFQQMFADLATTPVDEVAVDSIIDAVKRLRSYIVNGFYGDGSSSIGQVSGATSVTETAGGVVVAVKGNGVFAKFQKGDYIVAGSDADPRVLRTGDGASGSTGRMHVVAVDSRDRKVRLESAAGVGTVALSDNDHLMLEGTYNFGAASIAAGSLVTQGVENLIRDAGVFPGTITPQLPAGMDVDQFPELKGNVAGNEAAMVDPTMEALTQLLDNIEADSEMDIPNSWIAEKAVWSRMSIIERENNGMVQIPMGSVFVGAGGVAAPRLQHWDQTFQRLVSNRVRPNSILGINPSDWKKFMPMGDRTIHWAFSKGLLSGISSIFGPVFSGTQLVELAQAPFDSYCEFGLEKPRGQFRYVGLKTQRDL